MAVVLHNTAAAVLFALFTCTTACGKMPFRFVNVEDIVSSFHQRQYNCLYGQELEFAFDLLPDAVPQSGDKIAADRIVQSIMDSYVARVFSTDPEYGTVNKLGSKNKTAYDEIHWPDYTLSLVEVACQTLVDSSSSSITGQYQYLLQIAYLDPFATTKVIHNVNGGYYGRYTQIPSLHGGSDGTVVCIQPYVPTASGETPVPFQFPSNYFTGCDVSETHTVVADNTCLDCYHTADTTILNTIDNYAINAQTATSICSINDIAAVKWCELEWESNQLCNTTDRTNTTLTISTGIYLYRDWAYSSAPSASATWSEFGILHIFINYVTVGSELWTFRVLLMRSDIPGAVVVDEAIWFRFLDNQWKIVLFKLPIEPSTAITTTTTTPSIDCVFSGPTYDSCPSETSCAALHYIYPHYTVTNPGVNHGTSCILNFSHAPIECPTNCSFPIQWIVSDYNPPSTDLSSTQNTIIFSCIGAVLGVFFIVTIVYNIRTRWYVTDKTTGRSMYRTPKYQNKQEKTNGPLNVVSIQTQKGEVF